MTKLFFQKCVLASIHKKANLINEKQEIENQTLRKKSLEICFCLAMSSAGGFSDESIQLKFSDY